MSKKILLIDDQEIERTALRTIIADEPGWTLTETGDGEAALDQLASGFRPQLCLVDLRMPKVDGLEFLRRVRRDPDLRELKVMVVSASRDRTTIVELAKLGIAGYLLKPFDPQKTLATLRPVLAAIPDPDATPQVLRDLLHKRAVIIDDDTVARTALVTIVTGESHWTVEEFGAGLPALQRLRTGQPPDLVFLDLRLPDVDGIALLSELRGESAFDTLRVAITSGERDVEKIRALAKLRIDAYLLKPLDAGKVRAALRAVA